jgi:hypothetical protein
LAKDYIDLFLFSLKKIVSIMNDRCIKTEQFF